MTAPARRCRPSSSAGAPLSFRRTPAGPQGLPSIIDLRGWPLLHRQHVTQAPEGCDYDFLLARTRSEAGSPNRSWVVPDR
jgi:hypothetical protein